MDDNKREAALSQMVVGNGQDLFKGMKNMLIQNGSAQMNLGANDVEKKVNMLAQEDSESVPDVKFSKLDEVFANAADFKFA